MQAENIYKEKEKILIAYFSASGVTARLAALLSKETGASLYEIKPEIPYTKADLDWMNENSRANREMREKIRPPLSRTFDVNPFSVIFLGFPIWWYTAPTIINSFLGLYDMSGKVIIPFATSGSSPYGETNLSLSASAKGALIKEGKRFSSDVDAKTLRDRASKSLNDSHK